MSRHCLCRLIQVVNDTPSLTHALSHIPCAHTTPVLGSHTPSSSPHTTYTFLPLLHQLPRFLSRYIPPIYPQATILCTPPITSITTPIFPLQYPHFPFTLPPSPHYTTPISPLHYPHLPFTLPPPPLYTTPTSVLALGRFSRMSRSRRLVMLAVAFALTPAQVRIKTRARLELGEIRALDYLSIACN